jgi:alpha-ketoglutarate-dependent taurine dioxygenase
MTPNKRTSVHIISAPIVIESEDSLDLTKYFKANKKSISKQLLEKGAVLFRDFPIINSDVFESIAEDYSDEIMDDSVRLTRRDHVSGKINTSTAYNPDLKILLHTENTFSSKYPKNILFYAVETADKGGETPLSDICEVYNALKPETREKFERLGVLYVRNFWQGFGPDWKSAFNVSSTEELNDYCRHNSIIVEWLESNRPRLSQKWPAIVSHPITGKKAWFNHATTSNLFSVPANFRSIIMDGFEKGDYPNQTYYGDGSEIEELVLNEINAAYDKFEYYNSWQLGDLLLVDNMRLAHGRNSFVGERKVIVAMIDPVFRKTTDENIGL